MPRCAAPPGVEDVFGAVMVLLAGINPHVYVQKNGRVRDKDRTWDAAKKALLSNVNSFLDELKGISREVSLYLPILYLMLNFLLA